MIYAFDNAPLSALFKNFYRKRFPTLWKQFDTLVSKGRIISTREVYREIEDSAIESLREWAKNNKSVFSIPTKDEAAFVTRIFSVRHFQQNIEQRKLLNGGLNADPFIIARAAIANCPVVTLEQFKEHAAKIPNICRHFDIECISLEEFMEREGWEF